MAAAAVILAFCGNGFIDRLVPYYTLGVSALIISRYLAEKKEKEQPPPSDDDAFEESYASEGAGSTASARPLSGLKEGGTGKVLPALLSLPSPGGAPAVEMVSLGCGPRIKKLGFIEVKVYALGVYVERSERSKACLEPFKGGGDPAGLFAALVSQDSASFFPRALHMIFARSVTGKQVAEALAEKLKANLPAEVFERFSAALLAGIGPKGLGENDSLTFLWCAPGALRILVRGQAVGADLSDAKLPKVLHNGVVFGSDPGIPEAKATTAKGVARLFHGGGGAGPSALPARRARPATVTDPATGLALPTTLKLQLPSAAAGAGAPEAAAEVALLGCGVKVKKLGFVEINVYSVGVYAQPAGLKAALEPWHRGGAAGGAALFDGLLSKESFFPRALHMVFARGVTATQVGDSLAEKLKQAVSPEAFQHFSSTLLTGIGKGLDKGEALSYLWFEPEALRIFVRGRPVGDVRDEKLPRVMFVGFLGNDPGSPAAKAAIPKGAAALF